MKSSSIASLALIVFDVISMTPLAAVQSEVVLHHHHLDREEVQCAMAVRPGCRSQQWKPEIGELVRRRVGEVKELSACKSTFGSETD